MTSKFGPALYIWRPWRPRGGVLAVDFFRIRVMVLAARRWTGLQPVAMDNVAENVVRRAPCPVLIVRPRAFNG